MVLKLAVVAVLRRFRIVKCNQSVPEDGLVFNIVKNGFVPGIQFKAEIL